MYQPGVAATPAPVTCTHLSCTESATHVRGSFPFCFGHWLVAVMWEQPKVEHEVAS